VSGESDDDSNPWEGRTSSAAYNFGIECAKLRDSNPYDLPALTEIMTTLATELWDRGFSQTEIRSAFHTGADLLIRYCAGEERRGDRERYAKE
jgi:hypothetical protein